MLASYVNLENLSKTYCSASGWVIDILYPIITLMHQQRRNRNRSKRRAIYCPIHHSYLDSVSQKYSLYASKPEHLQQRGFDRRLALTVMASYSAIPLHGEWLEAFWCNDCQENRWYHVQKTGMNNYTLHAAPEELWLQASGVISSTGNPTVGEFTRRVARQTNFNGIRDFHRMI